MLHSKCAQMTDICRGIMVISISLLKIPNGDLLFCLQLGIELIFS